MNKNRNNKILIIILAGISLIVWGAVFDQLFEGSSPEAAAKVNDDVLRTELPLSSIAVSDSSFLKKLSGIRNPFQPYSKPKKRKRNPRSLLRKKPKKLPPIFYRGYLHDAKQPLAIVEMVKGHTQICAVGDSLGSYRITQISASQIEVLSQGVQSVLQLSNTK